MDHRTIFTKTAKGVREALEKTRFLSRDVRKVLVEVDGTASVADLWNKVSNISESKLEEVLNKLIADDYIREFETNAHLSGDTYFDFGATIGLENAHTQLTIGDFYREVAVTPDDTGGPQRVENTQASATLAERVQGEAHRGTLPAETVRRQRIEAGNQAKRAVENKARQASERLTEEVQVRVKTELEAKARRHVEVQVKAKAEAEAAEAARAAADALAQRAQLAQAEKEAEAHIKKEAEAQAQAAQRAQQFAEEKAQQAARRKTAEQEAQARRQAEAQAQLEAEALAKEQTLHKAREAARLAAEALAQREQKARDKKDAEERARIQGAEIVRIAAAAQARLEDAAKARQQAALDATARVEQERKEQTRLKDEERIRKEQELRSQRESEVRAREEATERARLKTEEIARLAAAAKLKLEEAEKTKREAAAQLATEKRTEQARLKEEERARKEQEQRTQREAETRAREEAKEQARLKAEELARIVAAKTALEAAEKARREAAMQAANQAAVHAAREREEQAQRKAQEEAQRAVAESTRKAQEQRAQREAEALARAEEKERAIEQARLKAQEAVRQAAEERTRRENEERAQKAAKAQAKEQARLNAEEEARLAMEEQARRKEEAKAAKAKKEVEQQARRTAQEQARLVAEPEVPMKSVQNPGRAEHATVEAAARPQTPAQAPIPASIPASIPAEIITGKNTAKHAEKAPHPDPDTKTPAPPQDDDNSNLSEAEAGDEQASDMREFASAQLARKFYLPSVSPARSAGLAFLLLLATGLIWLHLAPFNGQRALFEKAASAQFGQAVRIGQLNFSLLPQPHWRLQEVRVGGRDQIRIPQIQALVALEHLLDDRMMFKSVIFDSPALDDEGLGWLLFSQPQTPPTSAFTLRQISAHNVRLVSRQVLFPRLDASIIIGRDGRWRKITLDVVGSSTIENMHVALQSGDAAIQWQASADTFKPPFGPALTLQKFNAVGTLAPHTLKLTEFNATVLSGVIKGDASLTWGDNWKLNGALNAKMIDSAQFAPALLQGGLLEGDMKYSMQAQEADKLFATPRLKGNFTTKNGVLMGVDLASLLRGADAEGKSSFNSLSADFSHDGAQTQLRRVNLNAGLISAGGEVDVKADQQLRGRLVVRLMSPTTQARAELNLGGTLAEPNFEP